MNARPHFLPFTRRIGRVHKALHWERMPFFAEWIWIMDCAANQFLTKPFCQCVTLVYVTRCCFHTAESTSHQVEWRGMPAGVASYWLLQQRYPHLNFTTLSIFCYLGPIRLASNACVKMCLHCVRCSRHQTTNWAIEDTWLMHRSLLVITAILASQTALESLPTPWLLRL